MVKADRESQGGGKSEKEEGIQGMGDAEQDTLPEKVLKKGGNLNKRRCSQSTKPHRPSGRFHRRPMVRNRRATFVKLSGGKKKIRKVG